MLFPTFELEECLLAEEAHLSHEAKVLERQVQRHNQTKAATRAARELAESKRTAEAENLEWQQLLWNEVKHAIERLNEHRQQQLEKCDTFEQKLQKNIHAMIAMQHDVRRRAEVLEASFDAAMQRLHCAQLNSSVVE